MKDLTRWGRDYLQVGNAMEIFRRNNVRFIAVNNGIDSEKPDTFLLHLASRHAHVDGGQLVNSSLGVTAVVDTLRASGTLKIVV